MALNEYSDPYSDPHSDEHVGRPDPAADHHRGRPAQRQLLVMQRLRQRRSALGLTQKQVVTRLARKGVVTTNRALSSMEHGAGVDVGKLPDLADALDCTVTYLIGLTDDPLRWEPDSSVPTESRDPASTPAQSRTPSARPSPQSLILGVGIPDRSRRGGAAIEERSDHSG